MVKIQNWHRALTDFINKSLGLPFEWGTRDCCTYALDALDAMTDSQCVRPELTYKNKEEALAFSKINSLETLIREQFDASDVNMRFHQAGDIIIVPLGGFECAHVVFDRRAYAPLMGSVVQAFEVTKLYEACPDLKILRIE